MSCKCDTTVCSIFLVSLNFSFQAETYIQPISVNAVSADVQVVPEWKSNRYRVNRLITGQFVLLI